MSIHNQQLSPPADWQAFERMCFDLYREVWSDPNAVMHGRTGQPQAGVDVYGRDGRGRLTGVQCKGKNAGYRSDLTEKELREEVDKAKRFTPPLDVFVLATTSPSDVKIQSIAREIDQAHRAIGLFEVHVVAWDTLQLHLAKHHRVARDHLGQVGTGTVLDALSQQATQHQQTHDLIAELLQRVTAVQQAVAPGIGGLSGTDAGPAPDPAEEALRIRIKDAADLGNEGSARAAVQQLQRLRQKEWDAASPRSRHRLLYALGFAYLATDDVPEAIRQLRAAHAADPGKPWSQCALAFADMLEGTNEGAFAHASAALAADPSMEHAAVALAHSAPTSMSAGDVEAAIPAPLRERPQVLMALAHAASVRGEWHHVLRLSEEAYAKDPSDWRTQGFLGTELLRPVLAVEGIALTKVVPQALEERFRRGTSLLRKAWATVAANDFGARVIEFPLNLSAALDVAGDENDAREVIAEAIRIRPDNIELRRRMGMLHAGLGEWKEAIAELDHVPSNQLEPEERLIRVHVLLELGKATEAREEAARLRDEMPPGSVRDGAAGAALRAALALGAGKAEIVAALDASPETMALRVAAAQAGELDQDLSERLAADVERILAGPHNSRDVATGAVVLRTIGQPSRAADLLEPLTLTDRDTPLLRLRLRSLLDADRRREARELFESLPPSLRAQRDYVDLGVRLYDRIGQLGRARSLVRSYLDTKPDDLRVRLVWFGLSERLGDTRAALAWLRSISTTVSGSSEDVMLLAHLMDRHLADARCFALGYRALRQDFGNPRIHLSYAFGLFLMRQTGRAVVPRPEVVGPDTAVTLVECGGDDRLIRVIETEPEPRIERNEIPPDHPLATKLLGLRVGDEVLISDYVRRDVRFQIEAISSKYLHAHYDVLKKFRERFPEATGFGTVEIGPEDDPDRFQEMFRLSRERAEHIGAIVAEYDAGRISLAHLALGAGCSVFDIWDDYSWRRDARIACALGNEPERDEALGRLNDVRICVMDPLSVYVATALGIAATLRASFPRMAVTQSTIDHLAQAALERRHEADAGRRGSIVWNGNGVTLVEMTADDLHRRAAIMEDAVAFARSCELVSAEADRPIKPEASELYAVLPRANLDSLLAAIGSDGALLCEDMFLRHMGEVASTSKGVWIQAVLRHGLLSGAISPTDYADAVGLLSDAGHSFTSIGALELLHEMRRHHWMPLGRVQRYFSMLAAPGNDQESLASVVAHFLRTAWLETGGDHRFRGALWQLMRNFVTTQEDPVPLMQGWLAEIDAQFAEIRERARRRAILIGSTELSGWQAPRGARHHILRSISHEMGNFMVWHLRRYAADAIPPAERQAVK